MELCAVRHFNDMTVSAAFRSVTGQVGNLLRETRDTLLLYTIGQSNCMTFVTVCRSVTETVVDVRIGRGAGTYNRCPDSLTT